MKVLMKLMFIVVFISCSEKNTSNENTSLSHNPTYFDLKKDPVYFNNEKGNEFLAAARVSDFNSKSFNLNIDSAIIYFQRAIQADSLNNVSRASIAGCYITQKKYDKAIDYINENYEKLESHEIEYFLAVIYTKMNEPEKADSVYNILMEKYNSILSTAKGDLMHNYNKKRVLLILIQSGKDLALKEINKLIKNYPEYWRYNETKEVVEKFDKKNYLDAF